MKSQYEMLVHCGLLLSCIQVSMSDGELTETNYAYDFLGFFFFVA